MIQIDIPWPSSELMPNKTKGQHWGKTHAARNKAKQFAWAVTHNRLNDFVTCGTDIAIKIVFVRPNDESAADADNLLAALKPSIDGIALALKVNDRHFWPITLHRIYGPKSVKIFIGD